MPTQTKPKNEKAAARETEPENVEVVEGESTPDGQPEEAQGDGQPEAQQSEGKPSKPPQRSVPTNERSSSYIVFASTDEAASAEDCTWEVVGTYKVHGNGGQRAARQQALSDPENADLKQKVIEGGTVWFFCEPKQSFQPHQVRLDTPAEPKIIV